MKKNKTLIIFDIDGTLVYTTDHLDSKCFARSYETLYGKVFPTINWHQYPHVTDDSIIKKVIHDHFDRQPEATELERFRAHYVHHLKENRKVAPAHYRAVPGAPELIRQLLEHPDYLVGIATGGWADPARVKLNHVGIPSELLPLSGADGKETREDIIEELLLRVNQQNVDYDRKVYIGDALWDVNTTRNLNMNFVGIRRKRDFHTLSEAGASHVLPHFQPIEQFLDTVAMATPPRE